jgi:hypothetical protein
MQPTQNDILIYNAAISNGMTDAFSRCLIGQARNESGNYTSGTFKDDNNPFGMHYSKNNPFAKPSALHFESDGNAMVPLAHYDSLNDAIAAQVFFFKRLGYNISIMQSPDGYVSELVSNNYFPSEYKEDYSNIINYYYENFKASDFSQPESFTPFIWFALLGFGILIAAKKMQR